MDFWLKIKRRRADATLCSMSDIHLNAEAYRAASDRKFKLWCHASLPVLLIDGSAFTLRFKWLNKKYFMETCSAYFRDRFDVVDRVCAARTFLLPKKNKIRQRTSDDYRCYMFGLFSRREPWKKVRRKKNYHENETLKVPVLDFYGFLIFR